MRYFRGLTISLGLHIAIAFILAIWPQDSYESRLNTRQNFVELLEQPELPRRPRQRPRDSKQIVRSVEVPEELTTKEKKQTNFASEEDRYVLEEQRARLIDQSKNRSSHHSSTAAPNTKGNKTKKMDLTPESVLERAQRELAENADERNVRIGGLQDPQEEKENSDGNFNPLKNMVGTEHGLSTFGEVVPDSIKFGDFTALNTDRHIYYSFYSRMEEKIRGRWVAYARAAVYNSPSEFHRPGGKTVWTTKLEVILDAEGRFVKAILMEGSGSRALDSAPVQAFKEAYQFPNPPKEMIKEDGNIHIAYAFSVNISSTRYAEGN